MEELLIQTNGHTQPIIEKPIIADEFIPKQVVITLPGIKAVSRNNTMGHFINYYKELQKAETWMFAYGKIFEYHFTRRVDVLIQAYYKPHVYQILKRTGTKRKSHVDLVDSPNIDDKIFTDILVRWKAQKKDGHVIKIERRVWFIEDDEPKYLRRVTKETVVGETEKIVITITEVLDELM